LANSSFRTPLSSLALERFWSSSTGSTKLRASFDALRSRYSARSPS